MANAPQRKAEEAMKDKQPSPRREAFNRFTILAKRVIAMPKAEVDKAASAWTKKRRSRKH